MDLALYAACGETGNKGLLVHGEEQAKANLQHKDNGAVQVPLEIKTVTVSPQQTIVYQRIVLKVKLKLQAVF